MNPNSVAHIYNISYNLVNKKRDNINVAIKQPL